MAQPRFHFRLEPLLELRKQAEKEQQRKVAVIQQEINTLMGRIRQAEEMIQQEDHALASKSLTGVLDMSYIAQEKRYVGNLRVLILTTLRDLQAVEYKMVSARAELLLAAKARKVIEKLRQRQLERWQAEQARVENAQLDEMGTQLVLRKMAEAATAAEELV